MASYSRYHNYLFSILIMDLMLLTFVSYFIDDTYIYDVMSNTHGIII